MANSLHDLSNNAPSPHGAVLRARKKEKERQRADIILILVLEHLAFVLRCLVLGRRNTESALDVVTQESDRRSK